jgi:hypothetical protein
LLDFILPSHPPQALILKILFSKISKDSILDRLTPDRLTHAKPILLSPPSFNGSPPNF